MLCVSFDHFVTSFNAFTKFNAFGVREYSTRGGISLYQLKWLSNNELICDYMSELGISEDEVIYGAISLGYSKQSNVNPLKRNGNPVIFVK